MDYWEQEFSILGRNCLIKNKVLKRPQLKTGRFLFEYRYAKHYISLRMNKLLAILVLLIFVFSACKKEESNYPPPSIRFVTESGFVYHDTTLALGESFKIGILADNPNANLTNFIIRVESNEIETILDSGMNTPSLDYENVFTKGIKDSEKWTFIIRDRDLKSSEISINIKRDTASAYGNIDYFPSVEMGTQNHINGSFYSLSQGEVYTLEEAFLNQEIIDLCYFYDFIDTDENTIASPGANIDASVYPGDNGLDNWTTRRTTRFKLADISEEDFENATNDSLLIATYGQSEGKRKAKNLQSGHIFSFKNEDGKTGLFLVHSVIGTDEGTVNISIKVQE